MELAVFMPWLIAAAIFVAGWIIIKILGAVLVRALKKTSVDPILHKFISSGIIGICWMVLVGTVLSYAGVPVATFIAVLGAAGAAVALSLKDSLSNIAGGIIIIISKPFKDGDIIEIDGVSGRVDQIDLLFTRLISADGKTIHIPNGKLGTSIIKNHSAGEASGAGS